MNVLAVTYLYPPHHGAGAEWMLHTLLRDLEDAGHICEVVATHPSYRKVGCYCLDAVEVYAGLKPFHHDADVILTHLDAYPLARAWGASRRIPVVNIAHSDGQLRHARLNIANSAWVAAAAAARGWSGPVITVRPHVRPGDYYLPPGAAGPPRSRFITLVNLQEAKGASLFYRIAEAMPDRAFLGVEGAYGAQVKRDLPNVTIIPNQDLEGMRRVYASTRILLVPSAFESWGRVAVEAAATGTPVIAAPTAGLLESMADAAVFAQTDRLDLWLQWIAALDDDAVYGRYATAGRRRARDLDADAASDAAALYGALLELVA